MFPRRSSYSYSLTWLTPARKTSGMTDEPLTGSCLCGGVRYELTEPLTGASYCHCTRCQRRTGTAASANAAAAPGSLRITAGEELVAGWDPGDGGAVKCFCTRCGSALWSHNPTTGGYGVRLGTRDPDPGIRPELHQYVANAAAWEPIPDDGLPRYPERRPSNYP